MSLLTILGLLMFVTLEALAYQDDVKLSSLRTYSHKDIPANIYRFKTVNGKLLISTDYKAPLKSEVERLYHEALTISKTEVQLIRDLVKISDIKKDTLYHYFHRFTFAHVELAQNIINLLKKYIKNNSLFGVFI